MSEWFFWYPSSVLQGDWWRQSAIVEATQKVVVSVGAVEPSAEAARSNIAKTAQVIIFSLRVIVCVAVIRTSYQSNLNCTPTYICTKLDLLEQSKSITISSISIVTNSIVI